jgi:hypothetical protein
MTMMALRNGPAAALGGLPAGADGGDSSGHNDVPGNDLAGRTPVAPVAAGRWTHRASPSQRFSFGSRVFLHARLSFFCLKLRPSWARNYGLVPWSLRSPPLPLPVLPTHLSCPFALPTHLPCGPLVVHMGAVPGAPGRHPRVFCDLMLFASKAGIHPNSLAGSYCVARFRNSKPIETKHVSLEPCRQHRYQSIHPLAEDAEPLSHPPSRASSQLSRYYIGWAQTGKIQMNPGAVPPGC